MQRPCRRPKQPIASKVIQNTQLCVMIFPDSWLAQFAHVTPQISPDNTFRHSGWSHSPDLAAPANSGEERKRTFPLICPIYWKSRDSPALTPSVAPIDFEPFVSPGPRIASQELLESCTQTLQIQLAIMNWGNMWNLRRVWRIHLPCLAQCCHFLVVLLH